MTANSMVQAQKRPWHLWTVGIGSLLWNAMGAMDFVMTQSQNEAYMSKFTPEQLEFFYSFPLWVTICWAIAVWGAVIGSLFLLLAKAAAVRFFQFSLGAMVITSIHNFIFSDGLECIGDPFALVFTAIIFLVSLALYSYSHAMQRRHILS